MPLRIHIQPNSGVALYKQVANEVKAAFLRGALGSEERLPSVRELAAELGVNPTTIVKAYDQLENERLIVRRQGQGAFVAGGREPLRPEEEQGLLTKLARQLALEGRRLGWSEAEIKAQLDHELRALRPTRKRKR
ncbi:MAG: GntR family transcriptional regulator [bacterium]|nr:GntR family transcriptional regulator [bacterium]